MQKVVWRVVGVGEDLPLPLPLPLPQSLRWYKRCKGNKKRNLRAERLRRLTREKGVVSQVRLRSHSTLAHMALSTWAHKPCMQRSLKAADVGIHDTPKHFHCEACSAMKSTCLSFAFGKIETKTKLDIASVICKVQCGSKCWRSEVCTYHDQRTHLCYRVCAEDAGQTLGMSCTQIVTSTALWVSG